MTINKAIQFHCLFKKIKKYIVFRIGKIPNFSRP